MRLCFGPTPFEEEPFFSIDPLTTRGRLCLFLGLSILPLIPCLVVVVYASVRMTYAIQDYNDSCDVRVAFVSGMDALKVVSALHIEMAAGAASLVSNGSEIIDSWHKVYKNTDQRLSSFEHWQELESASKERFLSDLRERRSAVRQLNSSVDEVLTFYSKRANLFLDWLSQTVDIIVPVSATTNFVDFQNAVECLEELSIVRSLGVVTLLRGQLTPEELATFVRSLDLYVSKITSGVTDSADEHVFGELYDTANGMYDIVTHASGVVAASVYQSLTWYRRLSTSYDHLIEIVDVNYVDIVDAVAVDVHASSSVVAVYAVFVFVFVVVVSPIVIFSARNSVISLHGFARVMAMKLLEIKRERHRTEAVLNEMLPRIMTYKLRKGQSTPAEQYASATVFFSDIEDFSDISAKSAPIDIVVFLNDMYNHMDDMMDRGYDTYKVETIGCVYMVASGVPGRNGIKHASEIARMSLDLMKSTETFVIPHLPDNPLQLRAGIHSGPVVAGVVGNKMPRYCLFGDTVNTASRMQSNSKARRIQISYATKELLDEIGGFTTSERGLITVKGKGAMRTYWLISRERNARKESVIQQHNPGVTQASST